MARIIETFVDVLVIFGNEINVVEEKAVEPVLKGIKRSKRHGSTLFGDFESNIEQFRSVKRRIVMNLIDQVN